MSRQPNRGFWGSLFGTAPQHSRFSVQELQYLHTVLLRNPVVTDANRDTVVEALRSIAELVIWGDQHDSNMVEYFLTENLLGHFNQILQQRSNRRGNVAMQVLQTLSILIQNLRNQQTVYYLFSNNHINEIVSMRFDFDDDEVLGYYVNLLKTISLKLNETTVQFFFQQGSAGSGRDGSSGGGGSSGARSLGRPASFPLYTESIKFVNHRDPMVRTAVKTLTLNVYGIRLPAVQRFVTSRPAAAYLAELATYIAEQCQVLDRLLSSWDVTSPQSQGSVEACLAEVEDLLSYCNDVLATGVEQLRELLLDCLWQAVVGPVLFWPLIQEDVAAQHIAALALGGGSGSSTAGGNGSNRGGVAGAAVAGGGGGLAQRAAPEPVQRGIVGPLCSLYVFERLFLAITDPQLLTLLVSALLGGAACGSSNTGRASGRSSPSSSRPASPDSAPPTQPRATAGATAAALRWQIPHALLVRLQYSPAAYRQALLGMLRGTDAQVAAAAVRVLASLLQSRAVSEEQLELIGLLPQRRRKQRQLLKALVGDSPINSQILEPAASPAAAAAVAGEAPTAATAAAGEAPAAGAAEGDLHELQGDPSSPVPAEPQQLNSEQREAAAGVLTCNGIRRSDGSTGSSRRGSSSSSGNSSRASSRRSSSSSEGTHGQVQLELSEAADGLLAVRLIAGSRQRGAHDQQLSLGEPKGELLPDEKEQRQVPAPEQQQQEQPSPAEQQQQPPQQAPNHRCHPLPNDCQPQQRQQKEAALAVIAAAAAAEAAFADIVAVLLSLLASDLVPPLALCTVGWLLNRMLSMGKGGALLTGPQKQLLAAAAARHQGALQQQLRGRWCDALAPMVAAEWARSRQAILHTGPGSVHIAVQTWMQAVLVQELRWQQGAAGGAGVPDAAAVEAKQAYLSVQAAVAVLQLQQVLAEGEIPLTLPCPAVSDADVRQGEVREQAQIVLGSTQRMHCTVCFTRGQERQAYFAVEGLPAHVKAGQSAADLSLLKPSVLQQVAAAAPVLLVADPGTKPDTGLVLSVAPLMGAVPYTDAKHLRWLHVQVRPPLRGLLKVLQASHPGNVLLNLQKHLVSGHWVLAFPDGDRAASAQQHVEEWAHRMRAVYCQLLHTLLHSSESDSAGEGRSGAESGAADSGAAGA